MMTRFPPKTPLQMRREAEQRGRPRPKPLGDADPAKRPPMASESVLEQEATNDWLAHIAAGRIQVR